ncbi:MAG TPA: hypothetical protein VFE65_04255 [Pseudonocardia sp.]|nr:hypothetical protein [Pseudonocardia sp.]
MIRNPGDAPGGQLADVASGPRPSTISGNSGEPVKAGGSTNGAQANANNPGGGAKNGDVGGPGGPENARPTRPDSVPQDSGQTGAGAHPQPAEGPVTPPESAGAPKPPQRGADPASESGTPLTPAQIETGRHAYNDEVKGLAGLEQRMRTQGSNDEAVARALHEQRRNLGEKYKNLTPEPLRTQIYERNLQKYGDRLGPTIEYLRSRNKSWQDIIESAKRTGGGDLGLKNNQ